MAALQVAEQEGRLPPGWRYAEVVVLLKPGRPPELHSYRLICLLRLEAKLLAKVLVNRLLPYITDLVHAAQAGFMPRHATHHNIRCAHNAIAATDRLGAPAALLLEDIDKAFDSVGWVYLFAFLRRLNFGLRFLTYISLLYTDLTAVVRVAGSVSSQFLIYRGTRQGCPLSPYLFALAMDPLAAWVRMDAQLQGCEWSLAVSDQIALYADDVLFFITDPHRSGPRLLCTLEVF